MDLRAYSLVMVLLILAGCSYHARLPDFTASGYLADKGTVRIWRKNIGQQPNKMLTIYTPFNRAKTDITTYSWQQGVLTAIERRSEGKNLETVTLRFDAKGQLNFMQRQRGVLRQAIEQDVVALYKFDARRMLAISDSLLAGHVVMMQGHWQPNGSVITCGGVDVKPLFDAYSRQIILRTQANVMTPISISWLEAPDGIQLIHVDKKDVCSSEPKATNF
ncbi:DUF1481 domain-containing protein [Enterobacteriaceae bacterium LUAb1]